MKVFRKFAIPVVVCLLLSVGSIADVVGISRLVTDIEGLRASVNLSSGGAKLSIVAGGAGPQGGYYFVATSVAPLPGGGGFAAQGMFADWRAGSVRSYIGAAALLQVQGSRIGYDITPTIGLAAHAAVQ